MIVAFRGNYFFHYTTGEAAFAHILPERRLRLSPYSRMRDPLESKLSLMPPDEWPADVPSDGTMPQFWFDAAERIGLIRTCTKLLSLTVDDGPSYTSTGRYKEGWARARMWDQYADGHEGVCLLFHRERFEEVVLKQLRARSPSARAGIVRYTEDGLAAEAATLVRIDPRVAGEELASEHLAEHAEALFFLKVGDWEGEREYRFIEPSEDEAYSFVDLDDTLAAVIVGHKFPAWQLPAAIESCRIAGADVRQMTWSSTGGPFPQRLKSA